MADDTSRDIRKRILFISGLLGLMLGIAAYLVFKAVVSDRYILLVTMLPMCIAAVPLTKSLTRLFAQARAARDPVLRD